MLGEPTSPITMLFASMKANPYGFNPPTKIENGRVLDWVENPTVRQLLPGVPV